MADYWKSQAKKFCDFCKCWIADNRPSIEFHEKGKRHKENVAQRLKDISKKSAKEHKQMLSVDHEMKKMEEAALKAYMKDVEASADLTSKVIQEQIAEKKRKEEEEEDELLKKKRKREEEEKLLEKKRKELEEEDQLSDKEENVNKDEAAQSKDKTVDKKWYEAQSDEGYTYYWHIETGESVWEPPDEGFLSVEEQKEAMEKEAKGKAKKEKKALRKKEEQERKKSEEEKQKLEEQRAWVEREKMRSRRAKEDKPEEEATSAPVVGPAPRPDPYGGWTRVETKVEKPVDLQLPQQEYVEIKVPSVSEPQVKFKEKTMATLLDDCGTSSSFKKRKFNSRSIRQRLDED